MSAADHVHGWGRQQTGSERIRAGASSAGSLDLVGERHIGWQIRPRIFARSGPLEDGYLVRLHSPAQRMKAPRKLAGSALAPL